MMEIEGVDNETEGRETEGVDAGNDGVNNEVLPPEKKDTTYGILPLSTTIMEESIRYPLDGLT